MSDLAPRRGAAPSDSAEANPGPGSSKLAAGLYIVALPIGNAADLTLRALSTLSAVDAVACEDTRTTGPLLQRHGVRAHLLAYHEHNAARMRPLLLDRIAAGQSVALVSDAGMPLISDPGYKLVRAAIGQGLAVTCLPGPSAPLAALVLSGLPSDRFLFAGFPPPRPAARARFLAELAPVRATLVLFEAARRLPDSLADMAAAFGDRPAAVARELTKLFEEVRRGSLGDLVRHYAEAGPPPGEIVVVIGPPAEAAEAPEALDRLLREALGRTTRRAAVDEVAALTGARRRDVYERALQLGRDEGEGDGG